MIPVRTHVGWAATMDTVQQIDEELVSHLTEAAKQLNQSIRMRGFYPKGHVAVGASLNRLKEAIDVLLAGRGEITLSTTGSELAFEGHAFGGDKKPCANLACHLKVRNISGITFRSGLTQSELEDAVETLSASPESFMVEDSPLLGPHAQGGGVQLKRIRYDKVLRYVSGEPADGRTAEDTDELWRALLADDSSGGDEDRRQAMAVMAKSAESKTSLARITEGLVRAGRQHEGDQTAFVAKGLAMTCEGLLDVPEEQRGEGTSFLAEALENIDPEIILNLIERQGAGRTAKGRNLISEVARKLPTSTKLGVLAALIRSQRENSGRLSSVFSIVAGAEKRRRELLREIEGRANSDTKEEGAPFRAILSAVQDLVISEADGRFVGSEYSSLLEKLGSDQSVSSAETDDLEHLSQLRQSLSPKEMPATVARFLTDLAGLHETVDELRKTLGELRSTCALLCERKDFEPVVDATCELAGRLHDPDGHGSGKKEAVQECLGHLMEGGAGRLILDSLARNDSLDGRLPAVLKASGDRACRDVCELVASWEPALHNEHIVKYLTTHAGVAANICEEIVKESPAPLAKRTLSVASILGPPAVDVLRSALEYPEQSVQAEAVRILAGLRSMKANEILQGLLTGDDRNLMRIAATSMGESASPEAAEMLTNSLQLLDFFGRRIPEVRHVAAALGKTGRAQAVPQLERTLRRRLLAGSEAKRSLRETVAQSLKNIGDDEAMAALQRGASCRNRQVREICNMVLARPARRAESKTADYRMGADSGAHGDPRACKT